MSISNMGYQQTISDVWRSYGGQVYNGSPGLNNLTRSPADLVSSIDMSKWTSEERATFEARVAQAAKEGSLLSLKEEAELRQMIDRFNSTDPSTSGATPSSGGPNPPNGGTVPNQPTTTPSKADGLYNSMMDRFGEDASAELKEALKNLAEYAVSAKLNGTQLLKMFDQLNTLSGNELTADEVRQVQNGLPKQLVSQTQA
jgi:uncharacterized protein YecE (DUF72 family)